MEVNRKRQSRLVRTKNRRRKIISILRSIIFLTLILVLSYVSYGMYKEGRIRTLALNKNSTNLLEAEKMSSKNNLGNTNTSKDNAKKAIVPVEKKYKGYEVDSRLEIPKIELNTNVLKKYTTEGLEVCASKYYGPDANEIGNYCIAGHNYNKKKMFNHLIDLTVGDNIFLTDNENGIVKYTIYDIYKVKPQNVEPLSQETQGKRELTLITCVNYSRNRLVVKAIETNFE